MWAQGLTIGLLIVAGALTHGQRLRRAEEVSKERTFFLLALHGYFHSVNMITLGKT
jgi:hypothetical protein